MRIVVDESLLFRVSLKKVLVPEGKFRPYEHWTLDPWKIRRGVLAPMKIHVQRDHELSMDYWKIPENWADSDGGNYPHHSLDICKCRKPARTSRW